MRTFHIAYWTNILSWLYWKGCWQFCDSCPSPPTSSCSRQNLAHDQNYSIHSVEHHYLAYILCGQYLYIMFSFHKIIHVLLFQYKIEWYLYDFYILTLGCTRCMTGTSSNTFSAIFMLEELLVGDKLPYLSSSSSPNSWQNLFGTILRSLDLSRSAVV